MADFSEWQPGTAPSWLLGPNGEGLLLALGYIKDALNQGAIEAVKARHPQLAPPDALPALATDRNLERWPLETEADFRLKLTQAFDLWAKGGRRDGIEDALAGANIGTATVLDTWQIAFPPGPWGRFLVVLTGTSISDDGTWADPGAYDDGGTWDSTASLNLIALARRTIANWKGAHAECVSIVVLTTGELWDWPAGGTWGDPGTWAGEPPGVIFLAP